MITHRLISLFDFFLPRICICCKNKLLVTENTICHSCYSKIEPASAARLAEEFNRKFRVDNYISDFGSAFVFNKSSEIQTLIHSLKYNHHYQIGKFLGSQIAIALSNKITLWKADVIIPVPLHSLRKAERGFNQANEIAKGIASEFNLCRKPNIIKRNKFTKSQTKLNLVERKENIEGVFTIKNKKEITNKTIILVDDVITTGATTNECAKILLKNGAKNIYAISVAIAA